MDANELHRNALVIDGLVVAKFDRGVFQALRDGGVTAANCTVSIWEGFRETMLNVARFQAWIDEHTDLLTQAFSAEDVRRARREGRTAIILGFQNVSAIEDRLEFLRLFKNLGVGVMQLAYNTRNLIATGCYERDEGLSDFGREAVAEMNRLGILIDLSHVGPRSGAECIALSRQPVCYSHTCPRALRDHPRNKTDAELRAIVERGGFVGVTLFPPFLPRGADSTIDDWLDAVEHVLGVVGEDLVGIGTDSTQGHGPEFFEWVVRDKGYGRRLTDLGRLDPPQGFENLACFPNLTAAMCRRGWSETRIRNVLGENWLRLLERVWGE